MEKETLKFFIDAVCAVTSDYQTVRIAEFVKMDLPGRTKAKKFLEHYLEGSKNNIRVNIGELFADDPALKLRISELITVKMQCKPPFKSGSVVIVQEGATYDRPAYSNNAKAQDWRYAIGGFIMNWKEVSRTSNNKEVLVELSFRNPYAWDPKDNYRVSQCVHEAAENLKVKGAGEYSIIGDPYRIKISLICNRS